ncbi:hypothetical protein [Pseudomonas sp. GM30]|uniref:hypothetical protein n=1 Tax=Pseudomonas sp. GM30 TaxID=1144328 RepID=UPI00135F1A1B|nr:hypothetical protein [Pseudomonas sp. GM30]
MDTHSISNKIFELYPLLIPGWITPIKPADRADGGIPKSIYDGNPLGLQVVIDPWTERQFFQDRGGIRFGRPVSQRRRTTGGKPHRATRRRA